MANGKKGQLYQFMVPMVDATDFASVESAITESDFNSGATRKFYGCNHGGSAATTSGTISKTASLVRSGVFRLTLKTTENNYDQMMVRISKTGCAEQIIAWDNVDNDDSDIMSALTVIQSMASDAASAAQQGSSRALINQSRISDVASYLVAMSAAVSDVYSVCVNDIYSHLIGVAASDLSQINSRVLLNQSRISDVYSLLSDLDSNFQSRVPKETASKSLLSDANSDLASKIAGITASVSASDISDIASAVWGFGTRKLTSNISLNASDLSDLRSAIAAGPAATITASDISDIASAVRAILISDLSDIHSAATAGASRALINQSRVSDIQSFLSDFQSDLLSHLDTTGVQLNASTISDLRSAIAATELDASDLSDIASAVRTIVASDLSDIISAVAVANSRVLLNQSRISDIYSLLSDVSSDLTVLASNVSDIESAIDAGVPIGASDISDIRSAITAAGLGAAGADITGVPGVTASSRDKIDWLFALGRNKTTQTASLARAFNDAGSQIASATVSDDGTTFSRQEWAG